MKPLVALLVFTVALVTVGCKGGSNLAGTYTAPGNQTLTLGEDKKFTTSTQPAMAGTWSEEDNTVTLKVETVGGKPIKEALAELGTMFAGAGRSKEEVDKELKTAEEMLSAMKMTVSEDKKKLTMVSTTPGMPTTEFTKQEEK